MHCVYDHLFSVPSRSRLPFRQLRTLGRALVRPPCSAPSRPRWGRSWAAPAFVRAPHAEATTTGRSRSADPARPPNATRMDDPARTGETERAVPAAGTRSSWVGPVFWPHASDDMFEYAFLPNGAGERFWAYGHRGPARRVCGFGSFRGAKAVAADGRRRSTKEPPTDLCGSVAATSSADGVIAPSSRPCSRTRRSTKCSDNFGPR